MPRGNVSNHKRICAYDRVVTDLDRTDYTCAARDINVVADDRSSGSHPRPNCAGLMDRTIRAYLCTGLDMDGTLVSNEGAGTDIGTNIEVDVRNRLHEFSWNIQREAYRAKHPSGLLRTYYLLKSEHRKCPETFRSPAAVSVCSEARQISAACPPLAVAGPRFHGLPVVLHWKPESSLMALKIT